MHSFISDTQQYYNIMSLQIHYPNGVDKGGYYYDHFREGEQVKCRYVGGVAANFQIQKNLPEGDFRKREGYQERHRYANEEEKNKYGQKRFDELQKIIQEKLNPGELAGKYESGRIYINEKIPEDYRCQVAYHEMKEMEYHKRQKNRGQ